MSWDTFVLTKSRQSLFNGAWRRAQRVKRNVERLVKNFFVELTTVGIGVPGPPRLGRFTPHWEPLSDSWIERKGHDDFYFHTGALEQALRRKSTDGIFGTPVVRLNFSGHSVKVTSLSPPKKYSDSDGPFTLQVTPFPKVTSLDDVEAVVAEPGTKTFFKLINPRGNSFRPLVSPFTAWYIHTKIRNALR
jgi:hypothetical protein